MKIIHICKTPCSRVIKVALCQINQGHDVTILCQFPRTVHPTMQEVCQTWHDFKQLNLALGMHGTDADLLWVHTTISTEDLFSKVHYSYTTAPVIWDIHDVVKPDAFHLEFADLVLVPSEYYRMYLQKSAPKANVKTLYNKCPIMLKQESRPPKFPYSCVLASEVEPPGGRIYRDYLYTQQTLEDLRYKLFIYPASNPVQIVRDYNHVMAQLPLTLLLERMSYYEFGWAGAANDCHDIRGCVTNKFFEYLTAGISVATFRSTEMTTVANHWMVNVNWELGEKGKVHIDRDLVHWARQNVQDIPDEELFLDYDPTYLEIHS